MDEAPPIVSITVNYRTNEACIARQLKDHVREGEEIHNTMTWKKAKDRWQVIASHNNLMDETLRH